MLHIPRGTGTARELHLQNAELEMAEVFVRLYSAERDEEEYWQKKLS